MTLDALIIGGGITGLVCAYGLQRAGTSFLLCERGELGGLIRTVRTPGGYVLEQGPNVLVERQDVRDLVREIGLGDAVCYPSVSDYKQYVWCRGAPCEVPRSPVALFGSRLFSLSDKVRVVVQSSRRGVLHAESDDESIVRFLEPIVGRDAAFRVVEPVLKGIYGGAIERLSARSIFPGLWAHAKEGGSLAGFMKRRSRGGEGRPKIFTLRQGISSLVEALRSRISENVRCGEVDSLKWESETKTFLIHLSNGEEIRARQVFATTSGAATARYLTSLGGAAAEVGEILTGIRYAPLLVVHCRTRQRDKLPNKGFGVLFPEGQPEGILGVMCNSVVFEHTAPKGEDLLTLCFGGTGRPDVIEWDDSTVKDQARSVLERTLRVDDAEVMSLNRWTHAIPQLEVGHFKIRAAMKALEHTFPGLHFLGTDTGGIGVADRITCGLQRSMK
jgi:protoporphyrinogen/coproporphyrinogen III oxidase